MAARLYLLHDKSNQGGLRPRSCRNNAQHITLQPKTAFSPLSLLYLSQPGSTKFWPRISDVFSYSLDPERGDKLLVARDYWCSKANTESFKICEKCTDNPKYKICCDKHNSWTILWLCFGAFFCHSHAGSDEIKFKEGWSSCCTRFCILQAITYASPALNSPPGQCVGFPKNLWPV